jgi:hypothetical protein
MGRKKKVVKHEDLDLNKIIEFDYKTQQYLFFNSSKNARIYCTPEQLILKHAVPTKEMKELLNGDIIITKNGWNI